MRAVPPHVGGCEGAQRSVSPRRTGRPARRARGSCPGTTSARSARARWSRPRLLLLHRLGAPCCWASAAAARSRPPRASSSCRDYSRTRCARACVVSITLSGLSRLFGGELAAVTELAAAADEAGIDQIAVPDHLAIGPNRSLPYGRFPLPPGRAVARAAHAARHAGGATRRIRLATGVLIAPCGPLLLLAKSVATARRALGRARRSRRRARLAARGVRGAGVPSRAAPRGWRSACAPAARSGAASRSPSVPRRWPSTS